MKLIVKGKDVDVPGLIPGALPLLRLLQYRCPDLLVGGYRLGDMDIQHHSEAIHVDTMDKAQLAALGK